MVLSTEPMSLSFIGSKANGKAEVHRGVGQERVVARVEVVAGFLRVLMSVPKVENVAVAAFFYHVVGESKLYR